MGMFDNIKYEGNEYQTKDTPAQLLDYYEIRADGTLWHQEYDLVIIPDEDALLKQRWNYENKRWEFCEDFIGEIRFYRALDSDNWEEYSAYFKDGKLREINQIG
jgi:hypothetical protein